MTNFNFLIEEYSNQKHRAFQSKMSEVLTISLMPLTEQYRANLYKAYKCPDNNLIQINDISIHIVLYDPFSNLPLIELLQIIKPVKGHTSSITLYSRKLCQRTSTISKLFLFSLKVQPLGLSIGLTSA